MTTRPNSTPSNAAEWATRHSVDPLDYQLVVEANATAWTDDPTRPNPSGAGREPAVVVALPTALLNRSTGWLRAAAREHAARARGLGSTWLQIAGRCWSRHRR